jgi:hypothetical protein
LAAWRRMTFQDRARRHATEYGAGRRSSIGSKYFLVAAEFELDLFEMRFLASARVQSGDFHFVLRTEVFAALDLIG